MQLPRDAKPNTAPKLPRVIVWLLCAVIAASFIGGLWFVFPKMHTHQAHLNPSTGADHIANTYLRHEVEVNPKDLGLRLQLIEQELSLGQLPEAEQHLAGIRFQALPAKWRGKYLWLNFRLYSSAYIIARKHPSLSKTWPKKLQQVDKQQLAQLAGQVPVGQLTVAQGLALLAEFNALDLHQLARYAAQKLWSERDRLSDRDLLELAKQSQLAAGYLLTAESYLLLLSRSESISLQKKYYLKAVSSLMAGDLLEQHFSLIKFYAGRFSNDQDVLLALTRAALAADKPQQASDWARRALRIHSQKLQGGQQYE